MGGGAGQGGGVHGRPSRRRRAGLAETPSAPGVYFLLGTGRRLLYVGTASDVRRRLQDHARSPRWEEVDDVRHELLRSATAALAREADILAALRPPWNKSHIDGYFSYVTVAPKGLTVGPRGTYGCFPHLGTGSLSAPGRACIDGFNALSRVVSTARVDSGLLHELLSGRSSQLLDLPVEHDQPHVRHGVERDRVLAAQFYEAGPRAMRTIRLRHGGRGRVSRRQFTEWIKEEVAELIR